MVVACYCCMHPTRVRITSSCYALRVRGARDEVRLWCVRRESVREGSMVRVLYFCVPSNHNTPSIGSDGFEKVLIGTQGPRETFLDGGERASGEEQRFDERRKNTRG